MLAVRFHRPGDPSALRLDEVPDPRPPRGDELLVRVAASSINGTDLGLRRGDLRVATLGRLPYIPGFDLAGEVLGCGPTVTGFRPGDRVLALLDHGGGGQAELVLVRQGRAARLPASLDAERAAALPLAGLTALQALYGRAGAAGWAPGTRVLVVGAAGGIGAYGVQLAGLAGARVTGVASGAKLGFVRGLGAEAVIDYQTEDLAGTLDRFDVILDATGRYRFGQLRHLLTPGGVLVSTRPISPDLARTVLAGRGRRFVVVATKARTVDLDHLVALVERGDLVPPVDRTYDWSEAAEAHRHAEGPARGKVVLRVSPG